MHGKSCHRKDSSADDVHKSPHSPMPLSCNPSEVVRVQMFDGENVARPKGLLTALYVAWVSALIRSTW